MIYVCLCFYLTDILLTPMLTTVWLWKIFAFVVFMEGPLYSIFDSWRNVFVKCTFQRDW